MISSDSSTLAGRGAAGIICRDSLRILPLEYSLRMRAPTPHGVPISSEATAGLSVHLQTLH